MTAFRRAARRNPHITSLSLTSVRVVKMRARQPRRAIKANETKETGSQVGRREGRMEKEEKRGRGRGRRGERDEPLKTANEERLPVDLSRWFERI